MRRPYSRACRRNRADTCLRYRLFSAQIFGLLDVYDKQRDEDNLEYGEQW